VPVGLHNTNPNPLSFCQFVSLSITLSGSHFSNRIL
jgi:hypothetical protein